jgi:hypothetical protein
MEILIIDDNVSNVSRMLSRRTQRNVGLILGTVGSGLSLSDRLLLS